MKGVDYDTTQLKTIEIHGFSFQATPRLLGQYASDYETFTLDLFDAQLKTDSVVVDVGAHYGFYSLFAAKRSRKGRVISLEPIKENFEILESNIRINSLDNVEVHNVASHCEDAEVEFNFASASDSCAIIKHPWTETIEKRCIKARSLDSLLGDMHVDFIKIDVEGHEIETLKGAENLFRNNPHVRLVIEFNPKCLRAAGHEPEDMLEAICQLGFEIFFCDDAKRRIFKLREAELSSWREFMGEMARINLWCVPKSEALLVAFVSHSNFLGGAERSMATIASLLARQGIFSHVVIPGEGPLAGKLRKSAVSLECLSIDWPWITEKCSAESLAERSAQSAMIVAESLLAVNPDIVQSTTSVIIMGALAARLIRKPHAWDIREYERESLKYAFSLTDRCYLYSQLSEAIFFNSKRTLSHYRAHLVADYQVEYPPVELGKPGEGSEAAFRSENLKLLVLGSLAPEKNQVDVVLAVKELLEQKMPVELICAGIRVDDDYYKRLQQMVRDFGLEEVVRFLPFVESPFDLIRQSDVVVMPSSDEPFGRVLFEARMAGKLLIASSGGATEEVVQDGVDGLIYRAGDPTALAEMIRKVLVSPETRERVANAGKRVVEEKYLADDIVGRIGARLRMVKGASLKPCGLIDGLFAGAARHAMLTGVSLKGDLKRANEDLAKLREAHSALMGVSGRLDELSSEYDELKVRFSELDRHCEKVTSEMGAEMERLIAENRRILSRRAVTWALRVADHRLMQSRASRKMKSLISKIVHSVRCFGTRWP